MCNEFIKEGDLYKFRNSPTIDNLLRSRNYSERHIFLFDQLLVICKPSKTLGRANSTQVSYKFKDKLYIRKSDVFDIEDDEGTLKIQLNL